VSHDRSTVEAVVQHYFDAVYEGDADKLGAIFHPSADLRWLEQGELRVLTMPDWLDYFRKRPSAKVEGKPREDFIVTTAQTNPPLSSRCAASCRRAISPTIWWR
jgi:ketosteroid isomerase-like protein